MFWIIYIITIIVSYFCWRLYFRYGNDVQYSPVAFSIFIMFIPIANIVVPLIILLVDISEKQTEGKKLLDYKKIFRIK